MSKTIPDKRRRSPQKTAFWRRHVDAWRESCLSQADYSRRAGISIKCLGYWKRRFEREQAAEAAPAIVAVQLPQPAEEPQPASCPLLLHLRNGLRVEIPGGFDPDVLMKLVRTAEQIL